MTIDTIAKRYDRNLPRPINEQHLSSRRALYRIAEDVVKCLAFILMGLFSAYLLFLSALNLNIFLFSYKGGFVAFLIFCALVVPSIDVFNIKREYMRVFQRETFGTSRWATKSDLKEKNLLTPNDKCPMPEAIPIGTFGFKYWLTLAIKMMAKHVLIIGPHGSGKTASFFTNVIRAWASVGGALVLDISKNLGEVSRLTGNYYSNIFRLDLVNPECSDRFSLRACKRNPTLAYEVACLMVGYDPNNKGAHAGENPIWPQSAAALLKCLLLHLNDVMDDPTPADIFKYIAEHPYDDEEKIDRLKVVMLASNNPDVHEAWAMFERIDFKVRSSVYFSMSTPLEGFKDPVVKKVMTMPTKEEASRGCRVIDFEQLRQRGTVIYCVVQEGQASRLESVLATFFGIAVSTLRKNADNPDACHVLVSLDEAANVPFRNFVETLTVARGRKMAFMCGYQNVSQLEAQFGSLYAKAVRQAFLTRIFLPGLSDDTADFAVKMIGKTTTFQSSSNDAVGHALDSERLTEVGVDLMNATELREMLEFTQAIAIVDTAPPARIGFPPPAEVVDPTEYFPPRYDLSYPVTKEAIELYRLAMRSPLERVIQGETVRPALVGEEKLLLQEPPSVVAQQSAALPFSPKVGNTGQYSPFMQIPFAPYIHKVAGVVNQKTVKADAARRRKEGEPEIEEEREAEAMQFTDEEETVVTAPTNNHLAQMMSEQARVVHEDTTDVAAETALLRAIEDADSIVEDFPL